MSSLQNHPTRGAALKAIFVSQFEPTATGHGGNHRAYQIVHDLTRIVGEGNVTVITWSAWRRTYKPIAKPTPLSPGLLHRSLRRVGLLRWTVNRLRRLRERARQYWERAPFLFAESPIDPLMVSSPLTQKYTHPEFLAYYESIVCQMDAPAICLIEHVGFSNLLPINRRLGITTFACIQNVEALDTAPHLNPANPRQTYQTALNLADELDTLAQCEERLFISQVETALVNGLGLPSVYYPYLPVGEIRETLATIAQARKRQPQSSGLFLMLGSGAHTTTRHSFQWFVDNALEYGLPEGVAVVIAGSLTDTLLPSNVSVPRLTLKGWVEQPELDKLLIQAQAVLAPQIVGFGTLTRLPELAYAGIPVIVSKHPTYAIPLLPDLHVAANNWASWCEVMKQVTTHSLANGAEGYLAWEKKQANNLEKLLEKYICRVTVEI